ncbi:hypothetical protein B0H65DRAFT_511062 [Neurospora tetraspora]|uniref:Uncharacterized protein n=1 Tax=Neurospora tetraspora TaxID=94610 RepID=A0AAE0MPY8_9PEZI|nr:hypothetical protein B0H65DRAFT_511062 [Neurospora tetraspora]
MSVLCTSFAGRESTGGFSSEDWAGMTLRAPLPPLQNLSSLELHYCAWLNEAHLHDIIDACPKLATFKFTSEASPTTGQPIPTSSGFNFVGPALVLNALRPRSKTLTAISIRYMPVLDLLFRTHSIMDTDKNLIRTLGHFPNLRVLQISHDALQWTDSDGIRVSINDNNWSRPWTRRSLGIHASELLEKDHLNIYQETGIKLLIDFEDAYENLGTFSSVHEGLRHAVTLHPGIVRVSGLNFERDNRKRRSDDCGHHEIPEDDVPEHTILKSFHWPRGTKVLYGVLADGTSTEYYVNERRKLVVMHRDYGPWGFGVQVQGLVFDGLTVVE